jgi:hypothetical protein
MNDGEIINPGDLHGRVLQASQIDLAWDGNLVSALIGEDLVVGVSGFGDTIPAALRELAENLIREAVWIEIPDQEMPDLLQIRELENTTISTDVMELYRLDEQRMCVFVGPEGSHAGVFVVASSVHEALQALAGKLVSSGVWINVAAEREWIFQEISDGHSFLETDIPDSQRIEKEDDLD